MKNPPQRAWYADVPHIQPVGEDMEDDEDFAELMEEIKDLINTASSALRHVSAYVANRRVSLLKTQATQLDPPTSPGSNFHSMTS